MEMTSSFEECFSSLFFNYRALLVRISRPHLLSEAERRGSITYTVDFWANDKSPSECIITGIINAFDMLPVRKQLKGQTLKEFNASLTGLSAAIAKPTISTINQAFSLIRKI